MLHIGVQMYRIDKMNIRTAFRKQGHSLADVLKAAAEVFPSMAAESG